MFINRNYIDDWRLFGIFVILHFHFMQIGDCIKVLQKTISLVCIFSFIQTLRAV